MMRRILTGVVLWGMLACALCEAGEASSRTIVATFYPIQIAVLNVSAGVEGILSLIHI